MINLFKPIFLKNSKFKFQNVNYKAFSLNRLRRESGRNQINMNRDYSNVKILLDDEETNKLEKIPTQNMTNNQSNINVTNDYTKDKRWTKDYTYPLDFNILKYKLKDDEKTAWRKLPDEAKLPFYYKTLKTILVYTACILVVSSINLVLKPINNQYFYDMKFPLK